MLVVFLTLNTKIHFIHGILNVWRTRGRRKSMKRESIWLFLNLRQVFCDVRSKNEKWRKKIQNFVTNKIELQRLV